MAERSTSPAALIIWTTVFAVAMAYLESAVVVYLRYLGNPKGEFSFPIRVVYDHLAYIEIGRELATIVMLLAVAVVAVSNGPARGWRRYSVFLIMFAVWDIFYYIWLYVFIRWPQSLQTMDLLFLVPVPWIGPVYSPLAVSLAMLTAGVLTLYRVAETGAGPQLSRQDWLCESLAIAAILYSYVADYQSAYLGRMPSSYRWELLWLGLGLGLGVYLQRLYLPRVART